MKKLIKYLKWPLCAILIIIGLLSVEARQTLNTDSIWFRQNYEKFEFMVPMRDGVKLFTSVYVPKDKSQSYPFLMQRTPYSCAPYGPDAYPSGRFGPSMELVREGFILVKQDVRGRFMSEGKFTWMAPNKENPTEWDESADTYDTIDWLVKNIPGNNGKVGTYGGSYPGFYVTAGLIDAHPALVAAIPSAPMGDLWRGDDAVHNGAFLMPHNLGFLSGFGHERPEPTKQYPPRMLNYDTPDGYQFWLNLGPLSNVDKYYFKGKNIHWNEYKEHPVYDEFWASRNVEPHLKNIKPAVMTIGGWFDSQDMMGPFIVYKGIKNGSPKSSNRLILGPWYHGSWSTTAGDRSANFHWGSNTGEFYRKEIEYKFFNYHLKGIGSLDLPNIMAFNTGNLTWNSFDEWPPPAKDRKKYYLKSNGKLDLTPDPKSENNFDDFVSDPKKPVPYTAEITTRYGSDWMLEDQRFASRRPDVLVYESVPLTEEITISGPIKVHLTVSTSGTDTDFVVKVIDVLPNDTPDPNPNPNNVRMGGYQMLLRGDPIRAKFRNGMEKPEPMVPGEPTVLTFELADVLHTFKKGHKIMVQVQSTWFPMIDLNPGVMVDLFNDAKAEDFVKQYQKVYRDNVLSSFIEFDTIN